MFVAYAAKLKGNFRKTAPSTAPKLIFPHGKQFTKSQKRRKKGGKKKKKVFSLLKLIVLKGALEFMSFVKAFLMVITITLTALVALKVLGLGAKIN